MEPDPVNEEGRPYDFMEQLGQGAFGKVFHCLDRETHEECAVKIISKAHFRSELESILNEIRILSSLNHPNIVKFREVRQSRNHVYIEMELLRGGTLEITLGKKRFEDAEAAEVFRGMMEAVAYLHSKDIIHRDLKPANILFTDIDSLQVKVTDFGLSAKFAEKSYIQSLYQTCGTMSFMAPEQAQRKRYSRPVDIWSCGVILYMLITGAHPLLTAQETKESYLLKLQHPVWNFTDSFPPLARDLLERMIAVEPLERYTAMQVLQHPWITRGNHEIPRTYVERVQGYNDQCKLARIVLKYCALGTLVKLTESPKFPQIEESTQKPKPSWKLVVSRPTEDTHSCAPDRKGISGFLSPDKRFNHKRSDSTHLSSLASSYARLGLSPEQSPTARKNRESSPRLTGGKQNYVRANSARFVK